MGKEWEKDIYSIVSIAPDAGIYIDIEVVKQMPVVYTEAEIPYPNESIQSQIPTKEYKKKKAVIMKICQATDIPQREPKVRTPLLERRFPTFNITHAYVVFAFIKGKKDINRERLEKGLNFMD